MNLQSKSWACIKKKKKNEFKKTHTPQVHSSISHNSRDMETT